MSDDPMLDDSLTYSINRFPEDGSTTTWNLNFSGGYIRQEHVKAYRKHNTTGEIVAPVSITFVDTNQITTAAPASSAWTLVVYRDTPKGQPEVNFTDGSIVNERNLDALARQAVFVSAELMDRFGVVSAQAVTADERAIQAIETADEALDKANTSLYNSATAVNTANDAAAVAAETAAGFAELEAGVGTIIGGDFSDLVFSEDLVWDNILNKPDNLALISDITWSNVSGKPETFAPSAHSHAISDITGLSAELVAISESAAEALTVANTANSAVAAAANKFITGVASDTVASAATVDVGAISAVDITVSGTTTITSLGTAVNGLARRLTFSGVLTLTHNGTSLILPGAANITTAAGDVATFLSLGSGNWRCTDYQRASGLPVVTAPSFGGVIGDVFKTYATPQNSLRADGGRYLRSSYSELATKVGAVFDRRIADPNYTISSWGSGYVFDYTSNSRYTYGVGGNASPGTDAHQYWWKITNGPTYSSIGTLSTWGQSTKYCVMVAASETHLVVLLYNGSQHSIAYATLDANGDPGSFTEWTPAGLTSHCNGFGVVNGVFWLSYNVGGSYTAPRVAWGSNPASMTVSTPTGTDPRLDHSYSAYMFWDGTNYVFWSGYQWFSGATIGSLVSNTGAAFNGNTYIPRYTTYPTNQKPSYSADGLSMVHMSGSSFYYSFDGGYTAGSRQLPSGYTLFGAVIAGGDILLHYSQSPPNKYLIGRYDFNTGTFSTDTYEITSYSYTTNMRATIQGVFMHGSTDTSSTRVYFVFTNYDTKTTFAVPTLGNNYWIRAL